MQRKNQRTTGQSAGIHAMTVFESFSYGADVVKSGLEEFSLKNGDDIRDNNYESRMQRLLAEERKKISTIVGDIGDKRVLPLADDRQQLPVFRPPRLR